MSDAESSSGNASGSKKPLLMKIGAGLALLFVGIQFIPVEPDGVAGSKPGKWPESKEIDAILRRACYDCHSNEVTYPWYSKVAPMKWLVIRDVRVGRKAYNFSEWPEDPDDQEFERETVWDIIEAGEMPPWFYVFPAHPEAKLSEEDLLKLKKWATPSEDEEEEDDAKEGDSKKEAAKEGDSKKEADKDSDDKEEDEE